MVPEKKCRSVCLKLGSTELGQRVFKQHFYIYVYVKIVPFDYKVEGFLLLFLPISHIIIYTNKTCCLMSMYWMFFILFCRFVCSSQEGTVSRSSTRFFSNNSLWWNSFCSGRKEAVRMPPGYWQGWPSQRKMQEWEAEKSKIINEK